MSPSQTMANPQVGARPVAAPPAVGERLVAWIAVLVVCAAFWTGVAFILVALT